MASRAMRYVLLWLAACGGGGHQEPVDAAPADTVPAKAVHCATAFGSALTNAFGRLDGTVLAVIPANYQGCAQPNSTHVVVQVMVGGAAYRMVVNVRSTSNQPHVFLAEVDAPLAGPAFSEGWHPGTQLDYVTTLGVTRSQFTEADDVAAAARVYDMIQLDQPISIFATSGGPPQADSAHLIHRNAANADGAIVLTPDTAPHYLLTAFAEQSF